MYNAFEIGLKYLKYYWQSSNGKGHGIHSPFIYRFVREVLSNKDRDHSGEDIERLRASLKKDSTRITIEDFGAGSAVSASRERSIGQIARSAAKPRKYGQLLYRIVRFNKPAILLELGTSLGISTAYLALGNPEGSVTTLEGATELARRARSNLDSLGITNVEIVEGNFDKTLLSVLETMPQVDLAFIDGNHRQEPTLRYFQLLLFKTHEDSVLVFDDIHWSSEMERAWSYIKDHPRVTCTVDLFFVGLVFFRKEFKEKQHFTIRY